MKLRSVSVAVALILAGCVTVGYLVHKPHAEQAQVAVRFLGLTDDVVGAKLACFSLRNTGPCSIVLTLPRAETLHEPQFNGAGGAFDASRLLRSGRVATVEIRAPLTQDQWRATFRYHPLGLRHRVEGLAARLGLRMPNRIEVLSTAHSDWMPATQLPNWTRWDYMEP